MRTARLLTTITLATAIAAPLGAQVSWDSPMLVSPGSPLGWGVYLVDPWPGNGIGVMGTWRPGGIAGYRIGLAEGRGDDLAVFGGVDLSGSLIRVSGDFPLDMDWVSGVGLGFGDNGLLSIPLGVSLGRVIDADGVRINPYLSPRIVVDAWLGGDPPGRRDDLDLELAVDLGLDISFAPSWAIRFGGTLGDREAIAIGVSVQ
jgi:hypothetical protein